MILYTLNEVYDNLFITKMVCIEENCKSQMFTEVYVNGHVTRLQVDNMAYIKHRYMSTHNCLPLLHYKIDNG